MSNKGFMFVNSTSKISGETIISVLNNRAGEIPKRLSGLSVDQLVSELILIIEAQGITHTFVRGAEIVAERLTELGYKVNKGCLS